MKKWVLLLVVFLVSCQNQPDNEGQKNNVVIVEEVIESSVENEPIDSNDFSEDEVDKEETELPQAIELKVIVAVDRLNVRSGKSTSSDILGQLERDDEIIYTGRFTENDETWLQVTFEDQDAYIAERFTRNERRHNLTYNNDELLGYYSDEDLFIIRNTHDLKVFNHILFERLEATLNDLEVSVYVPIPSNTLDLLWDASLLHNDLKLDLKLSDFKRVSITTIDQYTILERHAYDGSIFKELLIDEGVVKLGYDYSVDLKNNEIHYINQSYSSELMVFNYGSSQFTSLDFIDPIRLFSIGLDTGTVETDYGIYEIGKVDDVWTITTDKDASKIIYEWQDNELITTHLKANEIQPFTMTSILYIEKEGVSILGSSQNYFVKEGVYKNQFVEIDRKSTDLYYMGQLLQVDGYNYFSYTTMGKHRLLTFQENEIVDDFDHQLNYILHENGSLEKVGNLIEMSSDMLYFISADVKDQYVSNIEVYDATTLEVIHEFEDYYYYDEPMNLTQSWTGDHFEYYRYINGKNAWLNLQQCQVEVRSFFNPTTLEANESIPSSETEVSTLFYNEPKGQIQGEHTVKVGNLEFANVCSYEEGQTVLWFYHNDFGYAKRPIEDGEIFEYRTVLPLKFLMAEGAVDFKDAYETIILSGESEYGFIHVTIADRDLRYELINADLIYRVEVGEEVVYSPNGVYMATVFTGPDLGYYKFQIYDLEMQELMYHHAIIDQGYEHIQYANPRWEDDKTISVDYVEGDINEKRYIQLTDDGFQFVDL